MNIVEYFRIFVGNLFFAPKPNGLKARQILVAICCFGQIKNPGNAWVSLPGFLTRAVVAPFSRQARSH